MTQPAPSLAPDALHGAVVLVTGGASGIGGAIVDAVLAHGGKAVVWDLRAPPGMRADVHAAQVDVSDAGAVAAAARALPEAFRPTHLVNNAGIIGKRMPLAEMEAEEIDRVLSVNLKSVLYCTRAYLGARAPHPHASIVNLSSIAARTGGMPGNALYATTKGAIAALTRASAKELAPGIRVNALAPGIIDTPIQQDSLGDRAKLAEIARVIPLQRVGGPEEVAQAALWLLSGASAYVTATIIDVAGGR
ncbi:oxidoreductase [Pseudoroseomonas deserti]|uniref:Oxidoreductase n=1 Tax=Teichococcus deserti TaxID=1817963 RepID=A0A1V2H974_9PROT|nr:SDR family oxidoreductase [Pseudoroseomonas deserti]ONG58930.1 oxidoreductase [Pseudoroseomonas deserti]